MAWVRTVLACLGAAMLTAALGGFLDFHGAGSWWATIGRGADIKRSDVRGNAIIESRKIFFAMVGAGMLAVGVCIAFHHLGGAALAGLGAFMLTGCLIGLRKREKTNGTNGTEEK